MIMEGKRLSDRHDTLQIIEIEFCIQVLLR